MAQAQLTEPAGEQSVYVRATAGPAFYSGVDPVDSGWGVTLDLGFREPSGFGLAAKGKFNFNTTGYTSSGGGIVYTNTTIRALYFGIEPSYSVKKGPLTLSLGVAIGAGTFRRQIYASNSGSVATSESSDARLAIVPNVHVDYLVMPQCFVSIGIEYLHAIGNRPQPGFFQPVLGFGYLL